MRIKDFLKTFSYLFMFVLCYLVNSCGIITYSANEVNGGNTGSSGGRSIPLHFSVFSAQVTSTPPTSIVFSTICNGGGAVSQTLNLATSTSVIVQSGVVCTLDMTSFVTGGVTYTPSSTHLIISVSASGAITANATSAATAVNYLNGSNNLYFVAGPDGSSTAYSIVLEYSTNSTNLLPLLPSNFTTNVVGNPSITGIIYSFINPSPNATTSLTLSVANTNAAGSNPTCVIVTEASGSAPTDQLTAATQYNLAVAAILAGTTSSGSYGNSCATSSSIYCRCPSAFNSTLVSGAGNWDIFYTTNQVIIWIDYDPNSPNGSAYTTLNVPAAP